jgi:hypothetical protein
MRNINQKHSLLAIMTAGICVVTICLTANAEEGGSGHYVPGSVATLIDYPTTQPGNLERSKI